MDDGNDSRPSFSASENSQNLSDNKLVVPDEFLGDPQYMDDEDAVNEEHIFYRHIEDNSDDDDYLNYMHQIDEDTLRLMDDMAYMEDLEVPDLRPFPSMQEDGIEKDLFGMVAGVMMANGSKLDSGLTAAEFDLQLQEVTGGQISMMSMAAFMKIANEEVDAINKQKGNLLLHDFFNDHLYYSAADGTFKLNPPPQLKELRETIKHGSACREKRREKADIVKNARMHDPEIRKKLMISNNFLVELIVTCCNSLFVTKVTWVQIQAEYKKMMTEETALYVKYQPPLKLNVIRDNIGTTLNSHACRELFGRGTVSKALSSEVFGKIKWTNSENTLILHLGGDYRNNLNNLTYNAEDFKTVQDRIDVAKAMSDETNRPVKLRLPTRQEREQQDLEERKKTFEPIEPPATFMPNVNEMEHRFHPGNKIRNTAAANESRAVIRNVFDQTEAAHSLPNKAQQIPVEHDSQQESPCVFGNRNASPSVSAASLSDVSEPPRAKVANFTDDENEEEGSKREMTAKNKEEQKKPAPTILDVVGMFGEVMLVKKNGSVAPAERLLRNKVVGFFFSALDNPVGKEDADILKTFYNRIRGRHFEVVYVSFDKNMEDFQEHFLSDHGDWVAIPFCETAKLAEVKARFPTAGLSELHILQPDGTCATKEAMSEIKASRNPTACFDKWVKFRNPTNAPQPNRRFALPQSTNFSQSNRRETLPQIIPATISRWEIPVESETAQQKYNRVDQFIGNATQPESSVYGSPFLAQPRVHPSACSHFQDRRPSESKQNVRPPSSIPIKKTDDYYENGHNSEDPSRMSHKALFIQHIKLHIYLHRNIDGAPVRYWSRMMSYLPPPFNMPTVILGADWINVLMDAIPCLQITATPHDDLLFDWVDKNLTRGESGSIRY